MQQYSNFQPASILGAVVASEFGRWSLRSTTTSIAAGAATITLESCEVSVMAGPPLVPLATNASLLIQDGNPSNDETVTPSAVSGGMFSTSPTFTATFANAHPTKIKVSSGTYGLQEAINFLRNDGGVVLITEDWRGTASMIANAAGATTVAIRDIRDGNDIFYSWNGANYIIVFQTLAGQAQQLLSGSKVLTDAAISIADVALPAGSRFGGMMIFTVEATDGTDQQIANGACHFGAVNKAGAYTTNVDQNYQQVLSGGTLTLSFTVVSGADKVTIKVTPAGSLTETTYRIRYTIINNSAQAITLL